MAISIDWGTKIITVPKSYLTHVAGDLYEMDTDQFRLDLKNLEDSEEGMPFPDTHRHNTEVTVAGVTYARTIEIINGYSITFEDGNYAVRLVGSNNNIFDAENGILNVNSVSIIPTNSAGLIVKTVGSGITEQDKLDIADRVWDEDITAHTTINSAGELIQSLESDSTFMLKIIKNKKELKKSAGVWQLIIYDDDSTTPILTKDIKDKDGNNISDIEAGVLAAELKSSV